METNYSAMSSSTLLQVIPCGPPQEPLPRASLDSVGALRVEFSGEIGAGYRVFGTTNVSGTWTVLGLAGEISPGMFEFTDLASTNRAEMFYRVRHP